jgi:hypothetical protein
MRFRSSSGSAASRACSLIFCVPLASDSAFLTHIQKIATRPTDSPMRVRTIDLRHDCLRPSCRPRAKRIGRARGLGIFPNDVGLLKPHTDEEGTSISSRGVRRSSATALTPVHVTWILPTI